MKRLAGLALCTVMMIAAAGGVLVFGDDASNDNNGVIRGAGSAEDVVYESVKVVDQHDIDGYISLQCDENKAVAGKENGEWKIVEESDAPVEFLNETQYAFKSAAEEKALEILNARMNGVILD